MGRVSVAQPRVISRTAPGVGVQIEFPVVLTMAGTAFYIGMVFLALSIVAMLVVFCTPKKDQDVPQQPAVDNDRDVCKDEKPLKTKRIKNLAEGVSEQYLVYFIYPF